MFLKWTVDKMKYAADLEEFCYKVVEASLILSV
jgi:hypothetical protein